MNRIKSWFRSLGSKMQSFLYGRYGMDALSHFLSITALIFVIIGMFTSPEVFSGLAMAMWLIMIFRTYSRNTAKRQRELETYLRITEPMRSWFHLQRRKWSDRKTHRYYKCSQCKAPLRVPKGKGKIKIHCPKCGAEIIKKT